jgi:hypothetical protein
MKKVQPPCQRRRCRNTAEYRIDSKDSATIYVCSGHYRTEYEGRLHGPTVQRLDGNRKATA